MRVIEKLITTEHTRTHARAAVRGGHKQRIIPVINYRIRHTHIIPATAWTSFQHSPTYLHLPTSNYNQPAGRCQHMPCQHPRHTAPPPFSRLHHREKSRCSRGGHGSSISSSRSESRSAFAACAACAACACAGMHALSVPPPVISCEVSSASGGAGGAGDHPSGASPMDPGRQGAIVSPDEVEQGLQGGVRGVGGGRWACSVAVVSPRHECMTVCGGSWLHSWWAHA